MLLLGVGSVTLFLTVIGSIFPLTQLYRLIPASHNMENRQETGADKGLDRAKTLQATPARER